MMVMLRKGPMGGGRCVKIALMAGAMVFNVCLSLPAQATPSETLNANQKVDARSIYFAELSSLVPDYEKINVDERFLRWLDQPDIAAGVKRQEILNTAYADFDVAKTAELFENFKKFLAARIDYPLLFPANIWDLIHISQEGNHLDGRIYVEKLGKILPNGDVEIWTALTQDLGASINKLKYQFHCVGEGNIQYRTTERFLSGGGQPSISTYDRDKSWKDIDWKGPVGQFYLRAIKACAR